VTRAPGAARNGIERLCAPLDAIKISHEFIYLFKLLERYLCWLSCLRHRHRHPDGPLPILVPRVPRSLMVSGGGCCCCCRDDCLLQKALRDCGGVAREWSERATGWEREGARGTLAWELMLVMSNYWRSPLRVYPPVFIQPSDGYFFKPLPFLVRLTHTGPQSRTHSHTHTWLCGTY